MKVDGPEGEYRFIATFLRDAAAAGGPAVFHVFEQARMPAVEAEVLTWGDDPALARWLSDHGIRHRPFNPQLALVARFDSCFRNAPPW